jgi:acyl carrier protein
MPLTETDQLEQVKEWLKARRPELSDIDVDLDLIENRIIDSLGFTEFLFFLEEVRGQEIRTDAQSVNLFRTLRSIRDNILNTVRL